MKRFLLLLVACVSLASCSDTLDAEEKKDPIEQGGDDNKEYTVSFKVDVKFLTLQQFVISDTSRSSLLYQKFYNDFIVTKKVIPTQYSLIFKKDCEIIGEYKGTWNATEIVLKSGTYDVTGECIGDMNTASLSFNEKVVINKETTIINLYPKFENSLFLFDANEFTNVWWCNGNIPHEFTYLKKVNETFYMFRFSELFTMLNVVNCDEWHDEISKNAEKFYGINFNEHLGVSYADNSLDIKRVFKMFGISDNGYCNLISPPFSPQSIPLPGTPDPLGRD